MVYQQYRKIEAGGISTEKLDSEIEVETSKDQGHRPTGKLEGHKVTNDQ